jgi:hypothetical protein
MVLSYYWTRPLYCLAWHSVKLLRKEIKCVLYCEDAFDAILFDNVQKHLDHVPLLAKNRRVQNKLKAMGYRSRRSPSFPDVVIMFRNMAWKFPCKKIVKIGFEHGAYNFKKFSAPSYYNLFTVFFMTSSADVARAGKLGITTAKAIGFPKIDGIFDGSVSSQDFARLSLKLGLDPKKKTLLFSSTWDASGMSAIHLWYKYLEMLKESYNILATTHCWTSDKYRRALQNDKNVVFITDFEISRYIMIADVCIGDTNSLLAEFCLLGKPIITFRVPPTNRTMPDVIELIEKISYRISTFEELVPAVEKVLGKDLSLAAEQRKAVKLFFDEPDGKAGMRAAQEICKLVPELRSGLAPATRNL